MAREDPALQLGSERAACPRSLLPPLELQRLAADESLESAALAFLLGVSLEHQKEKEEETDNFTGWMEELCSQRASLHRRHSGEWSPIAWAMRSFSLGGEAARCGSRF